MSKVELIDVAILKKELGLADDCDNCQRRKSKFTGCESAAWAIVCDHIDQLVEDNSKIEYVPVRHAYWIHEHLPSTNGGTYAVVRCSNCKSQFPMWETKYCPDCGAKMDKENRK